jgi:3-oxoacyl-[acyl-carrier protein] reductase
LRSDKDDARRIAFVTGGSRGIGAAVAMRLASDGYDIWLNYNSSEEAALDVKERIGEIGRRCELLRFDVADAASVEAVFMPALEVETPYLFVHNAGITRDTLLPMMKDSEWHHVMDVNLNSFFYLARAISKAMIRAREGRIIAITSVSGETGQAGQVNYAASKAGLTAAVKSLARELARRNILVNAVSPGLVTTDMTRDVPEERVLPLIPLARAGTVDEVAGAVSFLAGSDSTYITGQVLRVNGGLYI